MAKTYIQDEVKAKEWLEEHDYQITEDNKLEICEAPKFTSCPYVYFLPEDMLPPTHSKRLVIELPEFLFCFDDLVDLSIKSVTIKTIPESICNLTSLKSLHVSDCELKEIPESVGELSSLETLSICNNMIKALPDSICNLKNLKFLTISNNELSELPEPISNLSSLIALKFDENPICEIPEWITNLIGLTIMTCKNCNISTIPDYMVRLSSLSFLCFDNNNIPGVPCTPNINHRFCSVSLGYGPCIIQPSEKLALYAPKIKKMVENIGIPCKIGNAELSFVVNIYPSVNIDLGGIISRSRSLLEIYENITICVEEHIDRRSPYLNCLTFIDDVNFDDIGIYCINKACISLN